MLETGISFFRSLLSRDPGLASVRAELAQALLASGEPVAAISEASAALAIDDTLVLAWLVRGSARKALSRFDGAARDFEDAAALSPDRPMILVNLANSYAELDRLDDAERHLRRAVQIDPRCKEAQASLGSVLVKHGKLAEAEAPCRAALDLDPDLIGAHQNLSGILAGTDPAEARVHRDQAYRRQQIFVEPAADPKRTVLVLAAADTANVPLRHLMPRATTTLIHWYVEYASEGQDRALPPFDLVFNAIGDPDLAPEWPEVVSQAISARPHILLNDAGSVAGTRRDALPALLSGIPGIIVPPVIRHDGPHSPSGERLTAAGICFPVLIRPIGSHGGEGVSKIGSAGDLAARADGGCYLTEFVDFASPDGSFRKYRMIFVEGRAYPYHLAIGDHWLVHHWSAGMERSAPRRAEERAFLANPAAAIGSSAIAALDAIGARLGLEFAGIDFSVMPGGEILVFEANATMLVHPERDRLFAYRNPAVRAIQAAFDTMLARRQHRVTPAASRLAEATAGPAAA